jgi:hypothetical protein
VMLYSKAQLFLTQLIAKIFFQNKRFLLLTPNSYRGLSS